VRSLSIEPLLEDLGTINLDGIDRVIVGGESGPGARPMLLAWVEPGEPTGTFDDGHDPLFEE
jgi:protein gp37